MLTNFVIPLALMSAASAAVINVTVGDGGLVYKPNSVSAQVGDIVSFQFIGAPGNHTVSQSTFNDPCTQLSGGFDSGPVPVPSGFTGPFPAWNLTITNASAPIWFYCKATVPSSHCISGMVGAINAPSTGNTIDAFTSKAKSLSSLPAQSSGSLSGSGAAASTAPGPLPSSSGNGASSSSGSSASTTAPSAASSTKKNSATSMAAGGLWSLLAAVVGIAIV